MLTVLAAALALAALILTDRRRETRRPDRATRWLGWPAGVHAIDVELAYLDRAGAVA